MSLTQLPTSMYSFDSGPLAFRNRIINGDMRIDQRNAGASVTPGIAINGEYTLDRFFAFNGGTASKFSVQQNAGSVTPPTGFSKYLGATSLSSYTLLAANRFGISQAIEGQNVADLGWGTANASAITVSFWVRSSLTGIFGGSIINATETRSYPFTYTISSSNTWEQKTITIPGDTTGTWPSDNTSCIRLLFGMGAGSTYSGAAGAWSGNAYYSATGVTSVVGTSGATLYITGVQLEKGTTATPFEFRPYGTELILCQRYFEKSYNIDVVPGTASVFGKFDINATSNASGAVVCSVRFNVTKRVIPSMLAYSYSSGTLGQITYDRSGATLTSVAAAFSTTGHSGTNIYATNVGANWIPCNIAGQWTADAEL